MPPAARLFALLSIPLFALALWILHRELSGYRYADIARILRAFPPARLLLSLFLSALGYLVLVFHDVAGLRYAGRPLPFGRTALAALVGYGVSNNVGSALISGSIRGRFYTLWGLPASVIALVVLYTVSTAWLGVFLAGGLSLLAVPADALSGAGLPSGAPAALGGLLLALCGGWIAASVLFRSPLRLKGFEVALPVPPLALLQLLLGLLEWLLAGAALYVLLPPSAGVPFPPFLVAFLAAQAAGMASHVPGGLGVFETVMLLLLPGAAAAPELVGAFLVFRGSYYLLPLAVAAAALGSFEVHVRRETIARAARASLEPLHGIAPPLLSVLAFAAGLVLLLSGATPAAPARLAALSRAVPLAAIEGAHLAGSLAGMGLVLLAWGILHRLRPAHALASALLAGGVAASLLKGLDYEVAAALSLILAVLLPARPFFRRRTPLLDEPPNLAWGCAVLLALVGTAWLVAFTYKHVPYSLDLWTAVSRHGDAARSMRALAAATAAAAAIGIAWAARPPLPPPSLPGGAELDRAREIVRASPRADAARALLGERALMFGPGGRSLLAYGVHGGCRVVTGDPVGDEEDRAELIWAFHEACDLRGELAVFYGVRPGTLPVLLEAGPAVLPLGEEARVPLEGFSLEGLGDEELRRTARRLADGGAVFEVAPPPAVPPLRDELARVAGEWERGRRAAGPVFPRALPAGDRLAEFPVAVVRAGGRIAAFAVLLAGCRGGEIAADLLRVAPEAPPGAMDFLLVHAMVRAREEGYRWFGLGTAPHPGPPDRAIEPLLRHAGPALFLHGEHFGSLAALRRHKEAFRPLWEPRHLVAPGDLALPRVLESVAAVVGRGAGCVPPVA